MPRATTPFLLAAVVCLFAAFTAGGAAADGGYDCGLLAVADDGSASCREDAHDSHKPARTVDPSCRDEVDAVFWAGGDWIRLADALRDAPLPCGSYGVSIPALAANKRGLRVLQDDEVRRRGVEPLAEVNLGEPNSWATWVRVNGKSWYDAGVEFRRIMQAAGYPPGERWIVNELDYATIVDRARREQMRQLLAGLHDGAPGMEPLRGIALLGIPFRQQNIPDVDGYRAELQGFLADAAFWETVDRTTDWFAVEGYADTRQWAVDGSSRNERRRHLQDYLFHVLELAQSGPGEAAVARDVLERRFMAFGNAIWRARGGEKFDFLAGAGNTIVDDVVMRRFVSEQVHAVRHYQSSHPQETAAGAIGFAWQPCNRLSADEAGCRAQDAAFIAGLDAIATRAATAIGDGYRRGGASSVGACHAPGAALDWCEGAVVPGAAFTDAWSDFGWGD